MRHFPPPAPRPVESEERLDEFVAWVLMRSGLKVSAYRTHPLHRRLPACLRQLKVPSTAAARELLESRPALLQVALNAFLIGVTEFFREPAVFDQLQTYLQKLAAQRRRPLRVWSAACSTGAELYSVAILLAEAGLLEQSLLLGTDCRPDAVAEARRPQFDLPQWNAAETARRSKYFEPIGQRWRPIEAVRQRTHWKVADLLAGMEAGPWDIVLWRNAAIYLKPQVAEATWRGLASTLEPSGLLVTGKAERPPRDLGLAPLGRCLYGRWPLLDAILPLDSSR